MTIPKICCGLLEKTVETKGVFRIEDTPYLGDFLDEIALQRTSVRLLLGHQLTLHDSAYARNPANPTNSLIDTNLSISNSLNASNNSFAVSSFLDAHASGESMFGGRFHGIFEENCDFSIYVNKGIRDAVEVCEANFSGLCPNVNVLDKREMFECTYVPETLHHMIFELLKNSLRATIEHCLQRFNYHLSDLEKNGKICEEIQNELKNAKNSANYIENEKRNKYDINVILVDDINGDVTIKVEDQGGGIAKRELEKIFLYGYTTAYRNEVDPDLLSSSDGSNDGNNGSNNGNGFDRDSEDTALGFEVSYDLKRQRALYTKILEESERELDSEWQNVDSITDTNFMKFVLDEKYQNVGRSVLGALKSAPMFGLGYGLPVVRVYSKYFGGSCKVYTVHGHGTDVYLHCPNLSQLQDSKV